MEYLPIEREEREFVGKAHEYIDIIVWVTQVFYRILSNNQQL